MCVLDPFKAFDIIAKEDNMFTCSAGSRLNESFLNAQGNLSNHLLRNCVLNIVRLDPFKAFDIIANLFTCSAGSRLKE